MWRQSSLCNIWSRRWAGSMDSHPICILLCPGDKACSDFLKAGGFLCSLQITFHSPRYLLTIEIESIHPVNAYLMWPLLATPSLALLPLLPQIFQYWCRSIIVSHIYTQTSVYRTTHTHTHKYTCTLTHTNYFPNTECVCVYLCLRQYLE